MKAPAVQRDANTRSCHVPSSHGRFRTQQALLATLLDAHPKLLEVDDLLAGHTHPLHPEAALRVLLDDGLATRLGDLVGASRAAVRFEALRVSQP